MKFHSFPETLLNISSFNICFKFNKKFALMDTHFWGQITDEPAHLDLLPGAEPPQRWWREASTCPSLLLLPFPPPSTAPLHPLLHLYLPTCRSSLQACSLVAHPVPSSSAPLDYASRSLGERTPLPSPAQLQAEERKKITVDTFIVLLKQLFHPLTANHI